VAVAAVALAALMAQALVVVVQEVIALILEVLAVYLGETHRQSQYFT
jgi:hypothetical protein